MILCFQNYHLDVFLMQNVLEKISQTWFCEDILHSDLKSQDPLGNRNSEHQLTLLATIILQ